MKLVILIGSLILCGPLFAQEEGSQKGVILDSIPVINSQGETFALYLPEAFEASSLISVVFIFDPAARGALGIRPFIAAAEKYNYVLVCSNNSRNGPYEYNLQVSERLFNHIFTTYNIAERRIYTAGFSGGSRLALTIAVLSNAIEGVIGCGAGFSGNNNHFPSFGNTFSYVGLVGDRDMNYQEMQRAGRWLNTMNIDNEIFIYEDDHKWPPPEQLLRAFSWLELQTFKRDRRPKDKALINNIYSQEFSRARDLEEETKISLAVTEYERILRNFSPYYDLDSISDKINTLKKTKIYKGAIKDFKQVARLEDTLSFNYSRKFHKEALLGESKDAFKWWKKQLNKLDENYIGGDSDYLQKMGKRLRYQLFAMAIESFDDFVRNKEEPKAVYSAQFLLVLNPNNPFIHYRLASGFAKLRLKEKSLQHVEAALTNGWKRITVFEKDSEFNFLRNENKFKSLIAAFQN